MLYDRKWDQKIKVDDDAAILLRAAELLEIYEWVQAPNICDSSNRLCAVWAIKRAAREMNHKHIGVARCRMTRVVGKNIEDWNDQKGRTKDEVVSALKTAAYS